MKRESRHMPVFVFCAIPKPDTIISILSKEEPVRPIPYIGITGISLPEEPALILQDSMLRSEAKVMLGTCVSHKTLRGGTATKHPKRYPDVHTLEDLMSADPRVINLLHFNTKEPEHLLTDLNQAQHYAGPLCHGFQLNMAWPDIVRLEKYKIAHGNGHNIIVLQCGAKALWEVNNDPVMLAARVGNYIGLIDYVLIDPSGGQGQGFDINKTLEYFAALKSFENLGFGVAGGLSAQTLFRLRQIWEKFGNFSIDAESGLRRPHDDTLDVAQAGKYIKIADEVFMQRQFANAHRK